jgi:hypothetical protein
MGKHVVFLIKHNKLLQCFSIFFFLTHDFLFFLFFFVMIVFKKLLLILFFNIEIVENLIL